MSALINQHIEAIFHFSRVAKHLSFKDAADEMRIQPSTVSRHISALETALKFKLFHRTTRTVLLTSEGARFLQKVGPLFDGISNAAENAASSTQSVSGVVRIALGSTIADICLLPILPKLARDYPGITIDLVLFSGQIKLVENNIDFCVRPGKPRDHTLVTQLISQHQICRYSAPELVHADPVPDICFEAYEPEPEQGRRLTINDFYVVRKMIVAGLGQGWMPEAFCIDEEEVGTLVRLPPSQFSSDVYVGYPKGIDLTKRAKIVMDRIISYTIELDERLEKFRAKSR